MPQLFTSDRGIPTARFHSTPPVMPVENKASIADTVTVSDSLAKIRKVFRSIFT